MLLTGSILNQITPALKGAFADSIASNLNDVVKDYGMDKADILEEFIPNLLVECCEFTHFEENLNYSAARLMAVWPKRFPNSKIAAQYAMNPQKLANFVYAGRLGNNLENDGWEFRGSGPIQATGKSIVTDFTTFYNQKFAAKFTPYQIADMMRDKINLKMGLHFSCWFFSIAKGLIKYAIEDDFKAIVFRINGGYNGLDERTKYYNIAKKVLNA